MTTTFKTGVERTVALVLVVLAALLLLPMFAGGMLWGWGMPMMGAYGGPGNVPGWMAWVGPIMGLVWLVVLGGGAYLVYRAATNDGDGGDRAMTELRSAYARGDLTDEEFEKRRAVLGRDTDR